VFFFSLKTVICLSILIKLGHQVLLKLKDQIKGSCAFIYQSVYFEWSWFYKINYIWLFLSSN